LVSQCASKLGTTISERNFIDSLGFYKYSSRMLEHSQLEKSFNLKILMKERIKIWIFFHDKGPLTKEVSISWIFILIKT
jgi:hypothetical protein